MWVDCLVSCLYLLELLCCILAIKRCPLTCGCFRWDGASEELALQLSNKLLCCEKEKQFLLESVFELIGGLAGLRAQNAAIQVTVFLLSLPSSALQPRCGMHRNQLPVSVGTGCIDESDYGYVHVLLVTVPMWMFTTPRATASNVAAYYRTAQIKGAIWNAIPLCTPKKLQPEKTKQSTYSAYSCLFR